MESSSLRPISCWFLYSFSDGLVHRLSAAEGTLHKRTATGDLAPPQMLAARVAAWVVDESDWCAIVNAVPGLGSPPRSDDASPSVTLASPGVFVGILGEGLDAEVDWDLSDILLSGFITICSSLQGDISLIQEKCDEVSLNHLSNAGDVLQLGLGGFKTLAEQRKLLSFVDMSHTKAQESAPRTQPLECQVPVHSSDLASARVDMTPLEESVTVAQRQLAEAQSALPTVTEKGDEYRSGLGVEEQQRGSLQALLRGVRNRLVDHASFVNTGRGSLRQDMDHDLDVYLWAVFAAVRYCTSSNGSATSSSVETDSATFCQDVSSILMHLNSPGAVSASYLSVTTSSNPLGPGATLLPS